MSTPFPGLRDPVGRSHPAVVGQRVRERVLLCLAVLLPVALALAISVELPTPNVKNVAEVIGGIVGVTAVVVLVRSTRYTVTLTLLMLYLGLLDGPVKLLTGSKYASGFRDILMLAIAVGMLSRLSLRRERIVFPPLSGWVLAFVAVVIVEALNPGTASALKALGGYRQQLEFVPLFFFGYLIVRSKRRLRQLFLVLGVIALANGAVGAVQWRLSPAALAHWGPGYRERVTEGRTYTAEGTKHARPPALGSDAGFGGAVGVIAVPGLLALLTVGRLRRRWPVVLCSLGAVLGIATSASRSTVVALLVAVAGFIGISLLVRLRVSRALGGLLVFLALAGSVAAVLVAVDGAGIFKREADIGHALGGVSEEATGEQQQEAGEQGGGDAKIKHLNQIPSDILHDPLGLGLGSAGAVSAFGGKVTKTVEETKVSGGSAYNLLVVELGLPGLLVWVGFTISVLLLALSRLRQIEDPELRTYLVAILATFVSLTVEGLVGATLAVTPQGAILWLVPGVLAYWLAGPGRAAMAGWGSRKPAAARPALAS